MYPVSENDMKDLQNRFSYHSPKENQPERYQILRARALEFAIEIKTFVPNGRQQSLALTALEEVVMRANAGIAQGE
jgi:hypothetical protein